MIALPVSPGIRQINLLGRFYVLQVSRGLDVCEAGVGLWPES